VVRVILRIREMKRQQHNRATLTPAQIEMTGVFVNGGNVVAGAQFLTLDDHGDVVEPSVYGEFMPPTHLPLVPVLRSMGQEADWNRVIGEVALTGMNGEVSFEVGSRDFVLDGQAVILDDAAFEMNGELYVPLDFFTQVFGAREVTPSYRRVDVLN